MAKFPNGARGGYGPTGKRLSPYTQAGSSGLAEYSGWVVEEWLPALQGPQGRRVYREMQDNHPIIGAVLFGIEALVRQVAWDIKPGDDSPQGEKLADFCRDCLHDMHLTWSDTLGEILTFLPWGWAVNELVYKRRDDGQVGWWGWPLRGQESLMHWEFDDTYTPVAMVQLGPPDWNINYIPLQKCLHFRTTVRKNNPEGRALLRNAYTSWYMQKHIQEIEAIGIERDLAGFPVLKVPSEIMEPDAAPKDQAAYQNYQKILINLRRDDQEGLILPSDVDPESKVPLYEFALVSSSGSRQFDTDAIISRYDQRIAMAMLADFIMLGHENVGSYALGSSKINLFVKAMDAWLEVITAQVNGKAIPDLLRLNGIVADSPPTLYHDDIADIDLGLLGQYLTALSGAGVPMDMDPQGPFVKRLMAAGNLPEAADGKDLDDLAEQQRKLAAAKSPPQKVGPDGQPVVPGAQTGAGNGARTGGRKTASELAFSDTHAMDERWVTINGTHVLIDGHGNVVEGPHIDLDKHARAHGFAHADEARHVVHAAQHGVDATGERASDYVAGYLSDYKKGRPGISEGQSYAGGRRVELVHRDETGKPTGVLALEGNAVADIAVHARARGQGVARALLAEARQRGAVHVKGPYSAGGKAVADKFHRETVAKLPAGFVAALDHKSDE